MIDNIASDVLARIVVSYCTFSERIALLNTCKSIHTTIMNKPIDILEEIDSDDIDTDVRMPGIVRSVEVSSAYSWESIQGIDSIIELRVSYPFFMYRDIQGDDAVDDDFLPPHLESLVFDCATCLGDIQFPASLKYFECCGDDNEEESFCDLYYMPPNLEFLYVKLGTRRYSIEPDIINTWTFASSLKVVILHNFNQHLRNDSLPDTLIKLHLGESFNKPIQHLRLPSHLERLILGVDFNHPIERIILPASMQYLHFGSNEMEPKIVNDNVLIISKSIWCRYNHSITHLQIPEKINVLILQLSSNRMRTII
jgi:hypothetical protein